MTHDPRDDFLFDRTGPADPEVERLERVLRPLGARESPPAPDGADGESGAGGSDADRASRAAARGRRVPVPPAAPRITLSDVRILATLVLALIGVVVHFTSSGDESGSEAEAERRLRADEDGRARIDADALARPEGWIETFRDGRDLELTPVSRVRLAPRTRLEVRALTDDLHELYLERGTIEAFVAADARPRLFQVVTEAARCVDLGCKYTLTVSDDGSMATVRVSIGQVAFETPTREVFVPAGAYARAYVGAGPGTPRFDDADPAVASGFDAFDAAVGPARRDAALAALAVVRTPRDTLPAWHLLQEPDADVVRAAADTLTRVAAASGLQPPPEALPGPDAPADAVAPPSYRAAWKERLASEW